MDGSAKPFIDMLREAGRSVVHADRPVLRIVEPILVREGAKMAELRPFDGFHISFEIEFTAPVIGRQSLSLTLDGENFAREVADARTFGMLEEVDALRAAGLALGGSLNNSIVVNGHSVLNPEGLRSADEFVRHKLLDAVGDLYLAGMPIRGAYRGRYAGHGLNAKLLRALFARPRAFVVEKSTLALEPGKKTMIQAAAV
jgi:UDP-3-O-[3-hydroxymyristoyl] N-acetylglucosamine deacetylase